jgi:hypothetical protein
VTDWEALIEIMHKKIEGGEVKVTVDRTGI